ncbi:hypothetical protein LTR10_020619 [Elasticomyces elasticus]|uniref:Glycoside hydrolase family 43 protein n=1 Tax=Exophiala sideris TaxID=1016849 RepID=A0ABR0JPD6_9EURO|nr:hypothetical protein LTR10_020619 [Elasticomyces elasticus]KAK5038352.1 hypothetical protein LTS07_001822 [Exophiala sideris]KAK5044336.1 hypothetical protein LTR13_000692 [Exophiala sideris]KAK5067836.1 hypothetical protein LTR69_001825 [Exophiala sideris]KAK5183922.1 hypothetical protein LTR44_003427 [Eurotiomycetes sp. CCFEE 6388]
MLLASLVFLSGLTLALAAPLYKRQSSGPVIGTNFQDPAVLQLDDGTWIAYAGINTNPVNLNVEIATSTDFTTWTVDDSYDALPTLPSWAASPGHVWAPDVVQLANGKFVLYYSVSMASSPGQHCVAAATASSAKGPFTPVGSAPLFCDLTDGGAIDADSFLDPVTQKQYIVYKVDGNSKGHGGACSNTVAPIVPTPLILQEVDASDGYTFIGDPITVLENDASDGPNIEAPTLTYDSSSGLYVLFYSSECFVTTSYNIRYATSTSITGPYKKAADSFVDTGATAADVYIPGGFDVTKDGKYAVFHGDTNMGWFQNDGSKRVRAMYGIALAINYGNPAVSKMY